MIASIIFGTMSRSKHWQLKAPYSSKTDIFIQERFNKFIYDINTILKCGISRAVKIQLVSWFWTG